MKNGSVGTVKTQYYHTEVPLVLESGSVLPSLTIAYETYGTLNQGRSNAILICHALSGDAHAAGYHEGDSRPGWWDLVIGPGKAFDTDRYYIISSNVIGGCKGSTGPSSVNPDTGKAYATSFPVITIGDMVRAQARLVEGLGIETLYAVAGGSMGGMQAIAWAVLFRERVKKLIAIATTASSTPQQIAFNEVGRQAILSDPEWREGAYYEEGQPARGLALARMVGHITYLSDESMHRKFGRSLQDREELSFQFSTDFTVESYLHHQGDTFTRRFDANSYLYITKAIDYFDLSVEGSLAKGLAQVMAKALVVSVTSDWLYPPYLSEEIVHALSANGARVEYAEIRSQYGHDAFLLEGGQLHYLISRFLSHRLAGDVMLTDCPTLPLGSSIGDAARLMTQAGVNHLPVVTEEGNLTGIVTSWDIALAVAGRLSRLEEIMTTSVVTADPEEPIEEIVRRLDEHSISALPVISPDGKVLGIVTSEKVSTLYRRCG